MKAIVCVFVALGIVFYAISMKGQPSAGYSPSDTANYRQLATGFAVKYQISSWVFLRQINQESGWNPSAQSPAGAQGIAQFLPSTAASMGVDPWNVSSSLDGAARLDASLLHKYGRWDMALAGYNAGASGRYGVDQALARCGSSWLSCMPGQTQRYVRAILGG